MCEQSAKANPAKKEKTPRELAEESARAEARKPSSLWPGLGKPDGKMGGCD